MKISLYYSLYYFTSLFLIFLFFKKVGTKKIINIKNEDKDFYNLNTFINNVQETEELVLNFSEPYYDMSLFPSTNLEITVHTHITFIGNVNGTTVFDYGRKSKCSTVININNNTKGKIVKFENITFQHYDPINHLPAFQIKASHDQFQVIFRQCTFRDNDYRMVALDAFCNTKSQTNPQILFHHCNF